jgi:hypothetical protein
MPILSVSNGYTSNIYGFGQRIPFLELSERWVTKKVKDQLRRAYGVKNIKVSSLASYINTTWQGECVINGIRYKYTIT